MDGKSVSSKKGSSMRLNNRMTPLGEESLNEAKEEMRLYIDEAMRKLDLENKKKFADMDS